LGKTHRVTAYQPPNTTTNQKSVSILFSLRTHGSFNGYEAQENPDEEGPQEEGIETPFPTWPLPLEKADSNRVTFSP
jgi:hypothetical protein